MSSKGVEAQQIKRVGGGQCRPRVQKTIKEREMPLIIAVFL